MTMTVAHQYIETPLGRMTYEQAGACFGLCPKIIRMRVYHGGVNERTFDPKRPRGRFPTRYLTPWGMLTVAEIAERCGIRLQGMYYRLYRAGMPEEEAFNRTRRCGYLMPPEEYRKVVNAMRKKAWMEKHAQRENGAGRPYTSD